MMSETMETLKNSLQFAENELINLTSNEEMNINFNGIKESAENAFNYIKAAMFPSHFNFNNEARSINGNLTLASENLIFSIEKALIAERAEKDINSTGLNFSEKRTAIYKTEKLMRKLPDIRETLCTDITAAYQGDPAAKTVNEIILAYPAFIAICAYRVAHELYILDVPLIPRILTEYAHRLTGIDIHPGAKIGKYFFIDHGTGVVIGETSTIGAHVKIYQNVTIGAKSFAVEPDGTLVKNIKRHPDIGNNVIIYAGATILGGDTVIGDNCVIGGNVWLTHSVEAGKIVLQDKE